MTQSFRFRLLQVDTGAVELQIPNVSGVALLLIIKYQYCCSEYGNDEECSVELWEGGHFEQEGSSAVGH